MAFLQNSKQVAFVSYSLTKTHLKAGSIFPGIISFLYILKIPKTSGSIIDHTLPNLDNTDAFYNLLDWNIIILIFFTSAVTPKTPSNAS